MSKPADAAQQTQLARRNRRMALIHVAIALGFLIAFVVHTAQG